MEQFQRTFRVRTLAAPGSRGSEVRTDVRLRASSLAAVRQVADAIADAEALWREGDMIEVRDADDRPLLVREVNWRTVNSVSRPLRPTLALKFDGSGGAR